MISKLRFSLMAVIMLVLLGFSFQTQSRAQVGLNGLICPGVPDTTGYLEAEILFPVVNPNFGIVIDPTFSGAILGTVEDTNNLLGAGLGAGADWMHVDNTLFPSSRITGNPTNETGSQLLSWWTQEDGRNTYLQVTNSSDEPVTVHVSIQNENCLEIRNFCDVYTPWDTHEYNFGDLFSNGGAPIGDGNLQGVEGWVSVTSVTTGNCGDPGEMAIDHDFLSGQLIVHDSDDYLYGLNTFARQGICFNAEPAIMDVNLILNGSFQNGFNANPFSPWTSPNQAASTSRAVVQANAIAPPAGPIPPPIAQPPDSNNPFSNVFQAIVVASEDDPINTDGYNGGTFNPANLTPLTNSDQLVRTGTNETNVKILQSNQFNVVADDDSVVTYDLQLLTSNPEACANYAAVLLIRNDGGGLGSIVDARCYVEDDAADSPNISSDVGGNRPCVFLNDSDDDVAYDIYEFGGITGTLTGQTLSRNNQTGPFVVQVVAGQIDEDDCTDGDQDSVGALVDNFRIIHEVEDPMLCPRDRSLNGDDNRQLDSFNPEFFYGQFNVLPGNDTAGADAVFINIADFYGPPYLPIGANVAYAFSIFDEHEVDQSCGNATACFVRLGLDDPIVLSDDFVPPTLIPTSPPPTLIPTATPTAPPTLGPTATPTPTGGNNSGSCAIAGNPVQLGTALANVLIPLVPVAFAFGVRAVRRRKK